MIARHLHSTVLLPHISSLIHWRLPLQRAGTPQSGNQAYPTVMHISLPTNSPEPQSKSRAEVRCRPLQVYRYPALEILYTLPLSPNLAGHGTGADCIVHLYYPGTVYRECSRCVYAYTRDASRQGKLAMTAAWRSASPTCVHEDVF